MPVYCAAQWIATRGGQEDFDLGETGRWQTAFRQLLDRVASCEVRISGIGSGARELIPGVVFAGCQVDYPNQELSYELGWSKEYYLCSYPYVDETQWRKGKDDSFRNIDTVRWKQLMVAKEDIAQFWPFGTIGPERSGVAGRPTSIHLVRIEFKCRVKRGELASTLGEEAEILSEWLANTHPLKPPATAKTIKNNIRDAYREAKKGLKLSAE